MAAACIFKQCNFSSKPHLRRKTVVHGDRPSSPPYVVLAVSLAHPLFLTSNLTFCSSRDRDASFRVGPGLLPGNHGDANHPLSREISRCVKCEARTGKRSVMEDFSYDLYELLGVEKDARAQEIKRAYRWLQKKCHPDIAGPRGHDMSILLNDAYAVLSDPNRRASYDATCAEKAEFAGYTGEPLYSKWFGPPGEDRAVFVEETRCVGCLKCALIAPNTFAIESKYGRARAVGQWIDEESTIKDAIRACPVDCISWVDKGLLPALEFIMSKQPRLLVGIDNYSYVGVRQENVFLGANRFLQKYARREEVQASSSRETSTQKEARVAAEEEIHIKAGRWWNYLLHKQSFPNFPVTNLWDPTSARGSQGALIPLNSVRSNGNCQFVDMNSSENFSFDKDADLGPLLEAARHRRFNGSTGSKIRDSHATYEEEYWTPMEPISCPLPLYTAKKSIHTPKATKSKSEWVFDPLGQWSGNVKLEGNIHAGLGNIMATVPIVVSVTAAILVGMNGGADVARSETNLANGPLPASLTSGVMMQMFLTALVWYMIGAVVCEGAVYMTTAFVNLRLQKRR